MSVSHDNNMSEQRIPPGVRAALMLAFFSGLLGSVSAGEASAGSGFVQPGRAY